ncbi:hypothetical protein EB231_35085 [Mesorhizobium sp. NZP2298]|nr:hypothetical protein EB231_35085 [Mesorhizobium sp. NZP2298]
MHVEHKEPTVEQAIEALGGSRLSSAFVWEWTPQGHGFWEKQNEKGELSREGRAYLESVVRAGSAPKFAVGDKVRVVKDGKDSRSCHGANAGDADTVLSVEDDGVTGKLWSYYNDEVELIPTNVTSCAAAEVDNLADEYGGRAGLKIVAGRHYKTRDGRKVGPMEWRNVGTKEFPWQGDIPGGCHDGCKTGFIFRLDGTNYEHTNLDLIAEWSDSVPLRGVSPIVAVAPATTTAKSEEITMADIVRRLERLEGASIEEPIKVGDYVTLKVPARVTGIDKQNANLIMGGGGSFVLPVTDLVAA